MHPSLHDRAEIVELQPLKNHWSFDPTAQYRIVDTETFRLISLQPIEYYINIGLLVENDNGIMWATKHRYLLYKHSLEMMTPLELRDNIFLQLQSVVH